MRPILIAILLILLCNPAYAQWKKIADFPGSDGYGEYITCVYFLDLPGPPRIGFVGTESRLYKTTDGGKTWKLSWNNPYGRDYNHYYVTDICFKDSLTGWFSMFGDTDACYRTTDGGNNWKEIYSSPYGGGGVYYSEANRNLFLTLLSGTIYSTDMGNTWWPVGNDSNIGTPIFLSDTLGIAPGAENVPCDTCHQPDTDAGIFRTTNGGLTWHFIHIPAPQGFGPGSPITIGKSGTCFSVSAGEVIVWRSDDYGETWRKVADLGPYIDSDGNEIGPYGTGYIEGNLNRLSIQTDLGMYISADSGVTWNYDWGPPGTIAGYGYTEKLYSDKGVTIVGMAYLDTGKDLLLDGGLWEEIWPQAGVAELEPTSNALCVFPNPAGSSIIVESAAGPLSIFDPLGRGYSVPVRGNTLDISSLSSGVYFIGDGVRRTKFIKE